MALRVACLGLLLLAAAPPPNPTASDLIARNLAAHGGAGALSAINSIDLKGKYIAPGDFQLTYHETRARAPGGDKARIDLAIQGLTIVQAYDGTGAWKINPFQGRKDAERMSGDESRAQADASLIDGTLLASLKDGSTVRYLGREDYDGTLGYKVQVRQRDGDQFDYLLDPDSFLEIRSTETRSIRGAPQVTEYEYGDYEKVGGFYFPMAVDSWQPNSPDQRARILISSASANVAVDNEMFVAPVGPPRRPPAGTETPQQETGKKPASADPATPAPSKPR